jgi:hypothetical protein
MADRDVPDVEIETLHDPARYSSVQIQRACRIARLLGRGRLILLEPPQR